MKRITIFVATMVLLGLVSSCFGDIAPLALSQRAIGGGRLNQYTAGVEGGTGLNNIGLLIKTWGKVMAVDTVNNFFYLDDGTHLNDGWGPIGLRVSYGDLAASNPAITPPIQNSYVTVTGICSTWMDSNSKIHPNFRARRQEDIQTILTIAP